MLGACIEEENWYVYKFYADKFPGSVDHTTFSRHMDTCLLSPDERWLQAALDAETILDESAFENSSFAWDDVRTSRQVRMMLRAGRRDLLRAYKDFDRDARFMTLTQ